MKFSCDTCPVRGLRCDGCVMTVFNTIEVRGPQLDDEDHRILDMLCATGLVSSSDAAMAKVGTAPYLGVRVAG